MKTLYISDLDGTLLLSSAELSDYTVTALNRLIDEGLFFSVATARTAATCDKMLEALHLNVPVILMNGVLIYDICRKHYIKRETLTGEKAGEIIAAMKKTGITGLMYALSGETLLTYYEYISNKAMKGFIEERQRKFGKKFTRLSDLSTADGEIIYFCFFDSREKINSLYDEIKAIPALRIEKYQDIYSGGDLWYMEVFSDKASKRNALMYLKEKYGFERTVAFGDNLNDLPLFEASDECYAVANAKDELKQKATAVIGENNKDGVARWIEKNAGSDSRK